MQSSNCHRTGRFFLQIPLVITAAEPADVHQLALALPALPMSSRDRASSNASIGHSDSVASAGSAASAVTVPQSPTVELQNSISPTAASSASVAPHAKLHVLVVDDEASIRKVHKRFLQKLGDSCELLEDGADAVKRMLDAPGDAQKIDLIMMDIVMPRMGGLEACTLLREKGVDVPIIAVTSNAAMHDRDAYLKAGFTAVLRKPFTSTQLAGMLASATAACSIEES
jgi:CheY-like chemotaxis protein